MDKNKVADKILKHFASFGIALKIILLEALDGGSRLIYDVKPKKGTAINQLFERAKDIQIALRLPMFQLFWEGQQVRLAVSDRLFTENSLSKMLANSESHTRGMRLPIALGYDMRGRMFFSDLVEFVHAMYGGATNSGKTVGLCSLIMSIAAMKPVSYVNLIIIDAFTAKLQLFNPLPHLALPVVKEKEQAGLALKSLVIEMERRLILPTGELRTLPALVVIIDEYINLIKSVDSTLKNELVSALTSLLRLGRQAKIHIILATQEPGKSDMQINLNNLDGRIAFHCSNFYNSASILGCKGAETLPGKGAMYFKAPGQNPIPLLGAEMKPDEIKKLVAHIALRQHDLSKKLVLPDLEAQPLTWTAETKDNQSPKQGNEKELANIILWVLGQSKVSADRIKQLFHMSHRAYGIMEKLQQMGIIAEQFANQPRAVLPASIDNLSDDAKAFLGKHGISTEDIAAAMHGRNAESGE